MSSVKISLKIGRLEFAGEGEADWIEAQLDKLLSKAPEILRFALDNESPDGKPDPAKTSQDAKITLASFLREKNAVENQTRKFLATAAWLNARGKKRLKPGDVSHALRENGQGRVGNASQCLVNNITQGFCERDGGHFFVTDDGLRSL